MPRKKSPAYKMKGFSGFGNSPAKQGYTPHKEETHEERLNRVRKEKEKQHGTGYTPHKEETHEERLERVRKEKEKQHGTGLKTPKKNKKSPAKVSDTEILNLQHKLNKAELDFKEPGWAKVAGKLHDPLGIMGGGSKGGGGGGDTASKVSKDATDAKGVADTAKTIKDLYGDIGGELG